MRARRAFQPTVELMPLRLAPGEAGIMHDPMDPGSATPTPGPAFSSPIAPTSMPSGPISGSAPILDAGSSAPQFGALSSQSC